MSPLLDIHFATSSIEKSSAARQLPPGRHFLIQPRDKKSHLGLRLR